MNEMNARSKHNNNTMNHNKKTIQQTQITAKYIRIENILHILESF